MYGKVYTDEEKKMKRLFLIIAGLIVLLTGCSNKNVVPTETTETAADVSITIEDEKETPVETTLKDETKTIETTEATDDSFYQLPPYEYSGNDGIEKAITEFFSEADIYYKPVGAVMIPAFCIFREESTDDDFPVQNDVKVYGNFWMFVYSKRGKTLYCESGGDNSAALYLRKTGENSYEVTRMDRAADGSCYTEDIKRICAGNTTLEQQFFDSADAGRDPVKSKREWYIRNYVLDNNLDIDSYQDYGWDPVMLDFTENCGKEEKLSGDPRKYSTFAASEMHGLKSATLFIDGKEYSITDAESLEWIEDSFSRADELNGWPNCPYDTELILVRNDGASFKVQLATDSCNNLKAEDVWYSYHTETDDNTPLYDLFGIKVMFGKVVE